MKTDLPSPEGNRGSDCVRRLVRFLRGWINRMTSPPGCTAVDAEKLRKYNHGLAEENHTLWDECHRLGSPLAAEREKRMAEMCARYEMAQVDGDATRRNGGGAEIERRTDQSCGTSL